MTHLVKVRQALNLLILLLEKHLNQEHFTLFLNQIPAVFSVLRSLDGHVEASSFRHIDFVRDVGVDSEGCGLNICLTQLSKATFTSGSVFLPNFQFLIRLALPFLTSSLLILESEDTVIARISKWIGVLLESQERLGALTSFVTGGGASIQTGPTFTHITRHIY